jgi:hypothetical protein
MYVWNLNLLRLYSYLYLSSDILTYLDEVEHCYDATLDSAKRQLRAVKNTTQNSELKFLTVPRLVNFVLFNRHFNGTHHIIKLCHGIK